MSLNSVILVVEDVLGEVVSTKILEHFGINIERKIVYEGKSYLQQKARNFNRTAYEECGIFMLTDLDSSDICPPTLIRSWIRGPLNPWFFFRIAVIEVESWIMADRDALSEFLSIPIHRVPRNTDNIPNPKEFLVSLARRCTQRTVREALVPARGANRVVGVRYNAMLSNFVHSQWNLERAASISPSLKRTVDRIRCETEGTQKY